MDLNKPHNLAGNKAPAAPLAARLQLLRSCPGGTCHTAEDRVGWATGANADGLAARASFKIE